MVARIDEFRADMMRAWAAEERVEALRLVIVVSCTHFQLLYLKKVLPSTPKICGSESVVSNFQFSDKEIFTIFHVAYLVLSFYERIVAK